MHLVSIYWALMVFVVLSVTANILQVDGKTKSKTHSDILGIVKDFSMQQRLSSCVLHFNDNSWTYAMRNTLKDEAFSRYLGFDRGIKKQAFAWPQTRTSTVLHLYDDENIERLNVLIGKQNSLEALAPVGKQNGCSESVWLVHAPYADESSLASMFVRTPLRLDSHVYAFFRKNSPGNDTYFIYDIYKIDETSDMVETVKFAEWNASLGLSIVEENIWKRRSDLKGHHLSVVATVIPPFQTYLENGCSSSKCFKGVYADTFHALQEKMNFTFTVEWVKSFGGIENGKWKGMIGLLKDRKKDMGACAFLMSQSRATVVDFLPALMEVYQQMYIRNPAEQYDWEAYQLPLQWDSWLVTIIFCLLLPFVMVILMSGRNDQFISERYLLSDCYCLVYKSLLMMGCSTTPKTVRRRIVFISVLTGSMMLYWLWEAMLISYFAKPKQVLPFNSFDEFLTKSDKKVHFVARNLYVIKGSAYEYYFRNADDHIKKRIWTERMEPYMDDPNHPTEHKDLFPALMEDDNVVVFGEQSMKHYDIYKSCKAIALPRKYGVSQMGYTLQKNSSFTHAFTYFINQLIESGTVDRLREIYKIDAQVCPTYAGQPIGIKKCFFSFGILSIGGGLSIIWFLLEIVLPKKWLKTVHSVGDRIFQWKNQDCSLQSDQIDYVEKLEKKPRRYLINRIMQLEGRSNLWVE